VIGILMLNTRFPRLPGDIGNQHSFAEPPLYARVDDASVSAVVSDKKIDGALLDQCIQSALELQSSGATVIGTSCGFLANVQHDIQQCLNVPFISSSLLLVPIIRTMFGHNVRIGVLTFDAAKLGPSHFNGELNSHISIHGLDQSGPWYQCIAGNHEQMDEGLAGIDAMDVAARCIQAHPDTKVLLIECTNLSPWKNQMRTRFGLPVFDLVDALEWVNKAL